MMAGGIYDQLGGGFARYSVDAGWLVPHFEKMLYDNALLARVYLHGWQALGHERYRRVCEETLDYVLREMRGPEGGFYSAEDADSEGEEGKFYVWTPTDPRGPRTAAPTREPHRVPAGDDSMRSTGSTRAATSRARTSSTCRRRRRAEPAEPRASAPGAARPRAERVRPGLDDKVLAAWNGLAIAALAEAGAVFGRADYLDAARARRVRARHVSDATAACCAPSRTARPASPATSRTTPSLEALLDALRVDASSRAGSRPRASSPTTMIARFADAERGGFFGPPPTTRQLIARRKELDDHPIPSGNSAAAYGRCGWRR